jgi:2-C-methyl-D-erythritol 4-phosphate cytidylyltransferase
MTPLYALIPAAGAGSRLGGDLPKQYRALHGRPMLWHAMSVLADHPRVEGVAVALAVDDGFFDRFDWAAFSGKLRVLRCGGATRAQTVRNALDALGDRVAAQDWVLVHDAARPCLSPALLKKLIEELEDDAVGGLLALPAADTLKRANVERRAIETVSRDAIWQAQTPQMFRYALLAQALRAADAAAITDEAHAVEALGLRPRLIASNSHNLKVTYPEDLVLADLILRSREQASVQAEEKA